MEENDWCLRYLIPLLVFIEKLFINIQVQCVYQEDMIFPFHKRQLSLGICNFLARAITSAGPIIAAYPHPATQIALFVANALALLASFWLPTREEEIEFEISKSKWD